MKRGIKTFARSLRNGKIKKAREMFGKMVQGSMKTEIWEGYRWALQGMITALESGKSHRLPNQIAAGKCSNEGLEELRKEMEIKRSQEFRSSYERGYCAAWSDVLKVIIE